jgi:nucleotide-binding universal stress UspA family protein
MVVRKILFPTDFSETATYAWEHVATFAKEFDAAVLLLHVQAPLHPTAEAYLPQEQWDRISQETAREATEQMEKLIREAGLKPGQARTAIRTGVAFEQIIKAAREVGADLIVMGTHGRTGLAHALLGSVAQKVVRKAPCPVLTVRHPTFKFEMP